jgi:sortase A
VLFQPLYNTRIGENIYVTDFLNVYVYEVTVNEVIHDTQVEVVAHLEEGEVPIITLLRCEGNIGTRYRRLVQGKFVGSFAIDESQMDNFSLVTQGTGETGGETIEGIPALLPHNPVSAFDEISMRVAARMISDPIQVGLPLILLLLFPVIFLSILPSIKKK